MLEPFRPDTRAETALLAREFVRSVQIMKLGIAVATVTGLSLMIALLAYNDTAAVFGLVESVGWGLVGVVLVQACILALAGIGWARLVRTSNKVPPSGGQERLRYRGEEPAGK